MDIDRECLARRPPDHHGERILGLYEREVDAPVALGIAQDATVGNQPFGAPTEENIPELRNARDSFHLEYGAPRKS